MLNTTLTEIELSLARSIAALRDGNHKPEDSLRYSELDDRTVNLMGAAGEIAMAKLLNVYPDMDPGIRPWDILFRGARIDVKTSNKEVSKIFVPNWKEDKLFEIDYYFLVMTNDFRSYTWHGWIHRDHLIGPSAERIHRMGKEYLAHAPIMPYLCPLTSSLFTEDL